MPSGIIIKGIGGFYYIKADNDRIYECKARGIFRKEEMAPLPGDKVNITVLDENKLKGSIEAIHERETQLVRPAVANINQVAIVIAVKSPAPDYALFDKLLITAESKNIKPLIIINKTDLDEGNESDSIIAAYSLAHYTIIRTSSKLNLGFDLLKKELSSRITAFAGQSGVGKSTILNRIMDDSIMDTGTVSERIGRGKHTTRHAELVELVNGGFVVDTPGFSSFELSDFKHSELQLFYPEFSEHLNKCRFAGCSHISEPDCSIKRALEAGLIDKGRYSRFVQFYNDLKNTDKNYKGKRT